MEDDRANFLSLALEGYQRCFIISDKYDVKVYAIIYPSPLFNKLKFVMHYLGGMDNVEKLELCYLRIYDTESELLSMNFN